MQNIFSTINYQYPNPKNFDGTNPEFDIFKNVPLDNCFVPEIKTFKNIRITTNSVLFNYFNIIKESCISTNYEKYRKGFRFYLKFIFPKFNFSRKRFLLITDEWTSNYYHWHIFALKKLLILQEKGLTKDALIFLPKKYQRYKFVFPSLAKFGITEKQIIFLRRKSNIKTAEVLFVEPSEQHPIIFQEMHEILLQNQKSNLDFGDKIYISRAGQVLRFVENENEVVALLEKYGFKKIIAEKFSYDEQIAICSKAKYLIGPHGAGLTNFLFMKEDSSVLELVSSPSSQRSVTEYFRLASLLNINYFYQECKMADSSKVKDFHHASLLVNLEKLEKNLKLMLKND